MKEDSVVKDRDKYLGGSDLPTIMGINDFKSRFDLLLEKAGLLENDFEGNEYTEFGNDLEPQIRKFINLDINTHFKPNCLVAGRLRGNTDGINDTHILEIKTTGKSGIRKTLKGYTHYLVQLLFYMQLFGKDKGILAVYERPTDFDRTFDKEKLQQFEIELKDHLDLLEEMNKAIDKFLVDLEKVKNDPFITEEELKKEKK